MRGEWGDADRAHRGLDRDPAQDDDEALRGSVAELVAELSLPAGADQQIVSMLRALARARDSATAVRAPERALAVHVADSLSALRLTGVRAARTAVDIGSGAGFPGLALAIALPDARIDLVEATRRKCEGIARLAEAAAIGNACAVHTRAETWAAGTARATYDLATSRAVASLPVLAEYAAPLLAIGGSLVAWKGRRDPDEERAAAGAATRVGLEYEQVMAVRPYAASRDRHLHVLVKVAETPAEFPRRPGRGEKRPLG